MNALTWILQTLSEEIKLIPRQFLPSTDTFFPAKDIEQNTKEEVSAKEEMVPTGHTSDSPGLYER